jgi:hypothetical protein
VAGLGDQVQAVERADVPEALGDPMRLDDGGHTGGSSRSVGFLLDFSVPGETTDWHARVFRFFDRFFDVSQSPYSPVIHEKLTSLRLLLAVRLGNEHVVA